MLSLLHAEALYYGDGRHIGELLPRIAENNVLTRAYAENIAARPASWAFGCNYETDNLGLVWMVPIGLTAAGPISNEAIGALVAMVDAGLGVMIYADAVETAQGLGELVMMFAGGAQC